MPAARSVSAKASITGMGLACHGVWATAFIGMSDAAVVVPAVIVIGVVLAGISASIAIRRYLKV